MTFAEAICDRMKDLEGFHVVVNDRKVYEYTPSGHPCSIEDEECVVLAAVPCAGLHLRRMSDGHEISFRWSSVGSLRIIES